jgi:FdrA protein
VGISQAIGTGGRDVRREVGGIMFLAAMQALAEDEDTRVIVLVSKPPAAEVLSLIEARISEIGKPVVSVFLGAESRGPEAVTTLVEAAWRAVALARGTDPEEVVHLLASREQEIVKRARAEAAGRDPAQKYLRGLMSGGTFVAESQRLLCDMIDEVFSNAPLPQSRKLADSLESRANSVVDLGADEFTVGRPHPMIDYSLRKQRITAEANDPETAVILLDVVLGYGAHPDPATELADVVRAACQRVCVVCSITGTDQDPQNLTRTEQSLTEAGAIVMPSNAEATRLAGSIVKFLGES